MPPSTEATPTRVWDLPTRLFHWTLTTAIVLLIITGQLGGNALVWHMRLGCVVFTLLLFRLLWGVVGGRWSRFASFIYAPATVIRYLRGQARPGEHLDVGHNPLGSFSVFAFLAVLMVQVATGLVADDEIATTGPLYKFVSNKMSSLASGWHTDIGQWLLVALVLLHMAAILFYYFHDGKNLVKPMIKGDKLLPADTPASADTLATRLRAAALLAVCAGFVVWVVSLGT